MPSFSYKIRSDEGKNQKGLLQANSQNEAIAKVRKLGGITLEVTQIDTKAPSKLNPFGKKVGLKDRIIFTEQLAVMLNAGITLVQALKGLQEESTSKALSHVLERIVVDVEGGQPFSNSLAKHPKIFSNIYVQMVRSAEQTGNLADVLNKLTLQQQKEYELKGKVTGALIYPAIISVLLVGVIILVITFIIPKLTGLFTESGVSLPLSTRILIGLSDVFVHQWYILIGGLIAFIGAFRFMVSTEKGLFFWDALKMKIPVLGSFLKKSYMARFTQSFASLSQAGIPVLEVFKTLRGVIGNTVYEREIDNISHEIENGVKVSVAIRKSKYFPGMVGQLVSVGEQSGDLAGIFTVLGEFFEKEVDSMAKNLSTTLEPVIMIIMGVVIGFILVSVLQPIYGLVNAV
jgi:type IV pilus assembly protein PilC